jgi:hypothetical protein
MNQLLEAIADFRLAVACQHDARIRAAKADEKLIKALDELTRTIAEPHSWWNDTRIADDLKMQEQGGTTYLDHVRVTMTPDYEPIRGRPDYEPIDRPNTWSVRGNNWRPTGFASHPFAWSPGPNT